MKEKRIYRRLPAFAKGIAEGYEPAGGGTNNLMALLSKRLWELAQEEKNDKLGEILFVMPIVLVLVLDTENGGDATAEELVRRFHILDSESDRAIDFYFLGWHLFRGRMSFNRHSFVATREKLKKMGVRNFGGNADLILVDVSCWYPREVKTRVLEFSLDFPHAIQVDLSQKDKIPSLGKFLQSLIQVAQDLRTRGEVFNPTITISDRLGIAIARQSFLNFVFAKWGKIIGADKLEALATRNIGPVFYSRQETETGLIPALKA
jgi:hypothetical protein